MALQEKLDEFKKQQEKCQSTLVRHAASTKPKPAYKAVTAAPLLNATPPTPTVKFSSDIPRLQHIYRIQKSPVGAQIKRVIDLLMEVQTQMSLSCVVVILYV